MRTVLPAWARRGPASALALAGLFNLPFVLLLLHRRAYDTYIHLFLADHYRQRWWSLWEPRWYMGFSMASYPPLAHQLIALLSRPASALLSIAGPEPYPGAYRVGGEEIGFVLMLLCALVIFPLAVWRFARIFVGPRAARYAAVCAVCTPALSLSAWSFGQLPNVAATGALLAALERGYRFICGGRGLHLIQAVTLAGVTGALHHGVFLFAPFAGIAVALRALHFHWRARPPTVRWSLITRPLWRLFAWSGLSALVVALVLWPFLAWSRGQTLQTPIDHASRHNFFSDPMASMVFFWPVYGPLLAVVPFAVQVTARSRGGRWPWLVAWLLVFVLSLGGTTPLPLWLFGDGWEWLTFDRFGLWAAALLLPFAGAMLLMWRRRARTYHNLVLFCVSLVVWAWMAGALSWLTSAQPVKVKMGPLVNFLNAPERQADRYLTLGFGDQLARLSALTSNGSPDGDYHTARELPELRASGLGALDTALWMPQGVWALQPFLAHPERYGLRWALVHHAAYEPVLAATGWVGYGNVGEVEVWERPDVKLLVVAQPPEDHWAALWWGIAPLTILSLAVVALALERRG